MTQKRNLALFDLDHTLLPLDSDYQWADFLARTGRAGDPDEARRRNDDLMDRYNAGNLTAEQAAEFMLGLLAGKDRNELARWHDEFMRDIILPSVLPQARALVDQHLQAGDLCAIVTATNSFVTAPIAKEFGIGHLIATDPELRNDRYTGRIAGIPSFKAGKVTRVEQWLAPMGLDMAAFAQSWFYSDSTNDLPLLERVSHPVATNPSPTLDQIARERSWTILRLFDELQDPKS
ncbi:HAD family hydrolase [Paracandidimonas soli]|uniref:Histidinol-phosphatase n=1 Tax=Paracandidimonas soli TaxID=1917182 RepID=A0A4R3VCX6_9BURK|nr:HAD family hydrolase [Paracandidimonas soli]TCV03177.1 HAD superfamily hydrolase (TIGR01490 family) [Paracandidimonas soli]